MDEIKALVDIIVQNGIGIACVVYMIYFQLTTMKEMSETLNKMNASLELLNERMENLESRTTTKSKTKGE